MPAPAPPSNQRSICIAASWLVVLSVFAADVAGADAVDELSVGPEQLTGIPGNIVFVETHVISLVLHQMLQFANSIIYVFGERRMLSQEGI